MGPRQKVKKKKKKKQEDEQKMHGTKWYMYKKTMDKYNLNQT